MKIIKPICICILAAVMCIQSFGCSIASAQDNEKDAQIEQQAVSKQRYLSEAYDRPEGEIQEALLNGFTSAEIEEWLQAGNADTRTITEVLKEQQSFALNQSKEAMSMIEMDSSNYVTTQSSVPTSPVDYSYVNTRPDEAPYSINANEEMISTLSGSLSVHHTDLVLPGRSGLSFALSRTYNSNDAEFKKNDGDPDKPDKRTYNERMYPIGLGWSWDLSSIEFENNKKYIHVSGSGVYEMDDRLSNLKGYSWMDLTVHKDSSVKVGSEVSAYVLKSVRGINQYFNDKGYLIQISDSYNNRTTFSYTEHEKYGKVISSITDAIGNSITVTYSEADVVLRKGQEVVTYRKVPQNGKELLSQVVDQAGRITTYDYRIKTSTFSIGSPPSPSWTDNNCVLLTGITHPTGAKSVYSYEETASVRQVGMIIDYGAVYKTQYRVKSRQDQVLLSNGTVRTRRAKTFSYPGDMASTYDQDYTFQTIVDDGLTSTTLTYDREYIDKDNPPLYYLMSIVTKGGNIKQVTTHSYPDRHYKITEPVSTTQKWVDVQTNAESEVVVNSQTYDAYGNILTRTNPLHVTTTYQYNHAMHLLTGVTEPLSTNVTRYTEYVRNTNGSTTDFKVREGGPTGAILQQVSYENFDVYGNSWITRIKDTGRDIILTTEYGAEYLGAYPTMQTFNVTDANNVVHSIVKRYTYEGTTGRLKAYTDGNHYTTSYEYDALGRVTKAIRPDQSYVGISYDDNQNEISYTDETGITTVSKWDPFGLKYDVGTKEWGWYKSKQKFGYDPYGRQIWSEDALGNRTLITYDNWNRPERITYPDGKYATTVYDVLTNKVTQVDPEGVPSTVAMDILGRTIVTTQNGKKGYSVAAYDNDGRALITRDGLDFPTTFTYDALGRLTQIINAKSETTTYGYNGLGKLTLVTFPDKNTKWNKYDELGRLIQTTDANGKIEKLFYDGNNNRTAFIDRNGTSFKYTYDNRNFLKQADILNSQGQPVALEAIGYGYDLAGRRTSMTDATGVTTYNYDPVLGTLARTIFPDGHRIQYSYDAQGNLSNLEEPFHTNVYYDYDARNRLKTVRSALGDYEAQYSYYGNNLIKDAREKNGVTSNYSYDGLRLTSLIHKKADGSTLNSFGYTYDNNGNQISKTESNTGYTFTYDPLNRISTSTQFGASFTYDNRGNRTRMTSNQPFDSPDSVYTYDKRDRLSNVTMKNGQTVTYRYNGDGLLWERTENGQTTRYYYAGGQVVAEASVSSGGTATLKARYIRGNGLVAREDSAGKAYYLQNGHGDVVNVIDSTGRTTLNTYSYDIWGSIVFEQETVAQPFKYSSEMWDNTTNLQYLRARWYDPSIGRFINEDTYEGDITNPLTLNLYTYVGNNPLTRWDPTGHDWRSILHKVSGALDAIGDAITFGGYSAFNDMIGNEASSSNEYRETYSTTLQVIDDASKALPPADAALVDMYLTGAMAGVRYSGYISRKGVAHLDTNALIRALDMGEVEAIDNALAGRTPVVSITAAKEYLSKGDVDALRTFLSERGGNIGSAATEGEIQQLIKQADVLGRVLKASDASVAASAIKEGATLITNDARLAKFLKQAGFDVEGH